MKNILLLALILASPFCPAAAQKGDACYDKWYPYFIRNEEPNVYITFERAEKQNVLLRLRNSSNVAALVRADKLYWSGATPLTLCNGERSYSYKNGSRVNVKYEVEDAGRTLESAPEDEGAVHWMMWLAPGHSIIFPVSRGHLSRDLRIYVPLTYEVAQGLKEGANVGIVYSRIYVSDKELSKALRRK